MAKVLRIQEGARGRDQLERMLDDIQGATSEIEVRERLAEIELALEDRGWQRVGAFADRDFSRHGLRLACRLSRIMFIAHPYVRNGVLIQSHYVWGQGVNIVGKDDRVNVVIQQFLDHHDNKRAFSGHLARTGKEIEQRLSGNLFYALFTNPKTGFVRVRTIPVDEIDDIITNPEDRAEPWFYRRIWTEYTTDLTTGAQTSQSRTAYYPDWLYQPKNRPDEIAKDPVIWDAPIYHVATGGLDSMLFGFPEIYAGLDWARAVKEDLENFATIRKAQARFAWRWQTKGGARGVAAARTRIGTTITTDSPGETNPPPLAGSVWIGSEGQSMEPMQLAGKAPHPDEARRLSLMLGAAFGLPEPMLSGDTTVGNYATAKSLDRPTELQMRDRQMLHQTTIENVCSYVIDQAALATKGPLRSLYKRDVDPYSGDPRITLGDVDRRIDVDFPNILERDAKDWVQAIVGSATVNGQPLADLFPRPLLYRLLLNALGQDDVDELVEQRFPGGKDEPPEPPAPPPTIDTQPSPMPMDTPPPEPPKPGGTPPGGVAPEGAGTAE